MGRVLPLIARERLVMFDHLPPPFSWIVGGGFWQTLAICLVICPILPQLLGIVFASYWAPWSPRYQFLSYIPGNPFLALFIAGASTTFSPADLRIAPALNVGIFVGMFGVYVVLTRMDSKAYTPGQMRSANKAYHNLLYWWYGYLAVICAWALLGSDRSFWQKLLLLAPGLVWLAYLIIDSFLTPEGAKKRKLQFAHTDNRPLWRTGWKLRRRTATGYELVA